VSRLSLFARAHPWLLAALGIVLVLLVADEIDRRRRGFRTLGPHEAVRLINAGALVVDTRPRGAYEAGHIAHAIHIPPAEIDDRLAALLRKSPPGLVLYGPDAPRIARRLHARHPTLELGVLPHELAEWKAEHLPLVRGKDPVGSP
jgi:rhodanese-related sulfurtransferase